MNQKIKISIDKPCSENFEKFKSTDIGGFCGSCKKEVVDFTKMNQADILDYFKKEEGTTCGHFHKSQLRTYADYEVPNTNKYRLFGLVSFSLFSLLSINNSWGQKSSANPKTHINPTENKNQDEKPETISQTLISGIVLDDASLPLPGASITLKNTHISVQTNFDGEFTFPHKLKIGDLLIVSYIGYETFEYTVSKKEVKIIMEFETCILMGEVAVDKVYKSKVPFFKKLKKIFND